MDFLFDIDAHINMSESNFEADPRVAVPLIYNYTPMWNASPAITRNDSFQGQQRRHKSSKPARGKGKGRSLGERCMLHDEVDCPHHHTSHGRARNTVDWMDSGAREKSERIHFTSEQQAKLLKAFLTTDMEREYFSDVLELLPATLARDESPEQQSPKRVKRDSTSSVEMSSPESSAGSPSLETWSWGSFDQSFDQLVNDQ